MAIGGYCFDPQQRVDHSILNAMAMVCSFVLGRYVDMCELPYLYEHDYTCRMEIAYIIGM